MRGVGPPCRPFWAAAASKSHRAVADASGDPQPVGDKQCSFSHFLARTEAGHSTHHVQIPRKQKPQNNHSEGRRSILFFLVAVHGIKVTAHILSVG